MSVGLGHVHFNTFISYVKFSQPLPNPFNSHINNVQHLHSYD